jgi:hypothetical protein
MTNLPNLTNRAKLAIDVLADGGRFELRLERNSYTGREQWQYRLFTATRSVVRGVGLKAFYELHDAGFLAGEYDTRTSVSTRYKLNTGAA